jgi:multidrug efflux pump
MLFALSILVVFLCLAALYESWATPIAVLLVVPVGIIGSVFAAEAHGHAQRRVLQGRSHHHHRFVRKNAILIVEFASRTEARQGALRSDPRGRALRLRPILMTSFALHPGRAAAGVCHGRGRQRASCAGHRRRRRHVVGRDPGVLLAPIFFVAIRRMVGDKLTFREDAGAVWVETQRYLES